MVNDQFGSPTYAATLAANIAGLVAADSERYGVYHYCDRGVISWFDFAAGIMELALACRAASSERSPWRRSPLPRSRRGRRGRCARSSATARRSANWVSGCVTGNENLEEFFREKARLEGGRP